MNQKNSGPAGKPVLDHDHPSSGYVHRQKQKQSVDVIIRVSQVLYHNWCLVVTTLIRIITSLTDPAQPRPWPPSVPGP